MATAKFIQEVTVIDPDSMGDVQLTVFKHQNGGIFAIDSSWLEQCSSDGSYTVIRDPFENDGDVMLMDMDDELDDES